MLVSPEPLDLRPLLVDPECQSKHTGAPVDAGQVGPVGRAACHHSVRNKESFARKLLEDFLFWIPCRKACGMNWNGKKGMGGNQSSWELTRNLRVSSTARDVSSEGLGSSGVGVGLSRCLVATSLLLRPHRLRWCCVCMRGKSVQRFNDAA